MLYAFLPLTPAAVNSSSLDQLCLGTPISLLFFSLLKEHNTVEQFFSKILYFYWFIFVEEFFYMEGIMQKAPIQAISLKQPFSMLKRSLDI